MIDFPRAFSLAWDRTLIILFQPFDSAKWPILGFNAFLVMLGEGSIQFNQPISFTQRRPVTWTGSTLPGMIHDSKQWVDSLHALMEGSAFIWYLSLAVAYVAGWVVLNWVGCRGQFLFLDNIVRNRAAIAWPWRHYAREGNVWFLFQLGLTILTFTLVVLSGGVFLLVSWPWISQERAPQGGELAALAVFFIAFLILWCLLSAIVFILRSFVVPLLFLKTFGLGSALGAVFHLIFSRPLSMVVYVLASFLLAFAGALVTLAVIGTICCCICSLSLIPVFGSLLITAVMAQVVLPVFVYYRCFQVECLAQFGPRYNVWNVDVPPSPGAPSF